MRVAELDYYLPPEQIAQRPLPHREQSRFLLLNRRTGEFTDHTFSEFPTLLRGDELLVVNNARVIPARLFGRRWGTFADPPSRATRKEHLSGRVEVFLTKQLEPDLWEALVRPGRKMKTGERVVFGDGELEAEIVGRGEFGLRTLRFSSKEGGAVSDLMEKLGHVPLPPYIEREDEPADRERYQTVYARKPGAIAAPTAGLHFTAEILGAIRGRRVQICELTLDVGLGTFQPIHSEALEGHIMHAESYEIPENTVEQILRAQKEGRAILAVGTTVVRALEDAAQRATEQKGEKSLMSGRGEARLFITPGFQFRVANALLTNFHLPRSTLLALVCAFAGRENTLAAYHHAVQAGYRFYSYGDCMLIR
jgi:S-adenosylmethionine:tRNA ribosyltransferase-isomerase